MQTARILLRRRFWPRARRQNAIYPLKAARHDGLRYSADIFNGPHNYVCKTQKRLLGICGRIQIRAVAYGGSLSLSSYRHDGGGTFQGERGFRRRKQRRRTRNELLRNSQRADGAYSCPSAFGRGCACGA